MDHSIHSPERSAIDGANAFLYQALNLAEQMLCCGAEVWRVEDSIRRLGKACGAERAEVFSNTSAIIVTMYARSFGAVTQTRRVTATGTDLHKLALLNQLSRQVCREGMAPGRWARPWSRSTRPRSTRRRPWPRPMPWWRPASLCSSAAYGRTPWPRR